MSSSAPKFPPSIIAWILTILGLLSLALSVWASLPMLAVELGQRHVSAGGGEYFVALFFTLPMLILSALLLGICTFIRTLRSSVSFWGLGLSALGLAGWVYLIAFVTPG